MDAIEFSKAIKAPDIFLLDVRPLADYEKTHIEGAHHLDVTDENFDNEAASLLPKNKTIAVYCNTGKRSALAYEKLRNLGFNVINLDKGITDWIAQGLPTV